MTHWQPTKAFYCTDVRQRLHFQQLFDLSKRSWAQELAGCEFTHVINGEVRLKEGAMSTRKGRIIPLQDLIDEGFDRTNKVLHEK